MGCLKAFKHGAFAIVLLLGNIFTTSIANTHVRHISQIEPLHEQLQGIVTCLSWDSKTFRILLLGFPKLLGGCAEGRNAARGEKGQYFNYIPISYPIQNKGCFQQTFFCCQNWLLVEKAKISVRELGVPKQFCRKQLLNLYC